MSRRLVRRRSVPFAVLGAVALTSFVVPANAAAVPGAAPVGDVVVGEAGAAASARSTGVPVEVTAARTETSTLYANPDGTRTLEQSTEAVRVRRGDGWAAVDPTLARRADGTVAPRATTVDTVFSGGGSGPLATVTRGDARVALSFPTALPEPALAGPRATYSDVLPGVDLVVTAGVSGFSEVLVVKTRAAALSPALRRVAFPLATSGVTVRSAAGGGFVAVDAAGDPVFTGAEPQMWDSRGSAGDRVGAARDGDRVARMRAVVDASAVSVVPDAAMLADPATVFPVYLDPTVSAAQTMRAMVDETYPSNEYVNWGGDQGVGWQNFTGVSKKRLFYAFGTSAIAGKTVLDATFSAFETHAASCTPTEVQLWSTGGIGSGTNWSNQPAWTTLQDRKVVAYGRDGCAPGGQLVEFDATPGAKVAASTNAAVLTLGLRAASETNNLYWKRFRYDGKLSIVYNTDPAIPTNLRIASPSKVCGTPTVRSYISDTTPLVAAKLTDADGHNLYADFEWGEVGQARYWARTTVAKASGLEHTATIPFGGAPGPAFTNGKTYSFRVRGYDTFDLGLFSPVCDFTIDTVVPAPATVESADFPADTVSPTHVVGQQGWFTLRSGDATTDTDEYRYSFDSDAFSQVATPAALDGDVTIPFTPSQAGVHFLMVKAYDRADNVSTVTKYVFRVGNPAPSGRWRFDENTGVTAADTSGNGRTATVTSGSWSQGPWWEDDIDETDYALALSGTGYAQTATGSLDTGKPFTVGAYVYVDKADGDTGRYLAVSQNGVVTSGYQVGYDNGAWFFKMPSADTSTATWASTTTSAGGMTRRWVHLTAVYDGAEIRLYVRDKATGAVTVSTPVKHTSTHTTSGAVRFGVGPATGHLVGLLDEVATYPGVLGPDDIDRLGSQPHAQS